MLLRDPPGVHPIRGNSKVNRTNYDEQQASQGSDLRSEDAIGGGKKRGEENLTNDTPPERGFGPPSYCTFSTPLGCRCSVFPVRKSTPEQTRSSFGGSRIFREGALSDTLSSPHTFCTPPYHGPMRGFGVFKGFSERVSERAPKTSENGSWNGELVTECTSQRSLGTTSERLWEPPSDRLLHLELCVLLRLIA